MITFVFSILMIIIIYFIINPVKFNFFKIPLNIVTVPIFALLITFLFNLINFDLIFKGIIGNDVIQPWKVLIIFFGSAYISTSVDKSGIFEYISIKVLNKSKGRGLLLFIITYCFSWFLSIFTSNDIVILTLTPIIFYFSIYSSVNVLPLLFAEFIAANNGIFFITSNPVDTIIATALKIDQISYLTITILPTVVLSIVSLGLLYLYFKKNITSKFIVKDFKIPISSWLDANLSLIFLFFILSFLIISSFIKLELWIIILIGVLIFIIKDLLIPYFSLDKLSKIYNGKFWRFYQSLRAVPWDIFPFVVTMFIFVTAMNYYGLFDSISIILSKFIKESVLLASLSFGFLSLITENVINNQPMAMVFSNIFTNNGFQVNQSVFKASVYSVILAGNAGASLTLVGSLAGLMWINILKQKGIIITHGQFAKIGIIVVLPAVFISFLVLVFIIK